MADSSLSPLARRMQEFVKSGSSAPGEDAGVPSEQLGPPRAPNVETLLKAVEQDLADGSHMETELIDLAETIADCDALLAALAPLLHGDSPSSEHLDAYRALRDSRVLPDEAGFFLVAHALTLLGDALIVAALDTDPSFQRIDRRASEIRQQHGLSENEDWPAGQGPPEYRALDDVWTWLVDDIRANCMTEQGEFEMARLYRHDPIEFWRLYKLGRLFFFPADGRECSRSA